MNMRRGPTLWNKKYIATALVCWICTISTVATAGVQEAARLSVVVLAEFCVVPLSSGAHAEPPFKRVDRKTSRGKNTVNEWWAGNGTILTELRTKDGELGCQVTMAAGQSATPQTLRLVEQNFEQMMNVGRLHDQFIEVEPCSYLPDYFKMYESLEQNPNGFYLKVFLNTRDDIGFLNLVGAEADDKPHSCTFKKVP